MAEQALMTPAEIEEIRSLCVGLHLEIGTSSLGPQYLQCLDESYTQRIITRTSKLSIYFKTDAAAEKWNAWYEDRIRWAGHLATAAVTVIVTLAIKKPATSIGIGTGAAIGKDEVQTRIPYPYARRGWRIEIPRVTTYRQNALSGDRISMEFWKVGYDHQDQKQYKLGPWAAHFGVGEAEGHIPRAAVLNLLAAEVQSRSIVFE